MPNIDKRNAFIDCLVDCVQTHHDWHNMSKQEVILLVGNTLMNDAGAAQDFLDACNININLLCLNCKGDVSKNNPNQLQFYLGDTSGNYSRGSQMDLN